MRKLLYFGVLLALVASGFFLFIKGEHSLDGPSRKSAHQARRSSRCYQAFSKFYNEETIIISVIFGYKDARPARFVGDRYERMMFLSALLAPCSAGETACGFSRRDDDTEILEKTLRGLGQQTHLIRVFVVGSSAGPDDNANRKDPFQDWMSLRAKSELVSGISRSRAVLYNGHSRDGGGPDFSPPKLIGTHVDYGWYGDNTPGLSLLLMELVRNPFPTPLLGLFSCASSYHFSSRIREVNQGVALVTSSKLLYYVDALENTHAALSALLGMWCEEDFVAALKGDSPEASSSLQGFF